MPRPLQGMELKKWIFTYFVGGEGDAEGQRFRWLSEINNNYK
jgi:hypothetical protein